MRDRRGIKVLALFLSGVIVLSGCTSKGSLKEQEKKNTENSGSGKVEKADTGDIDGHKLRDQDVLYQNDEETSIVTMYLTVSRGNTAENTDHSWDEINTYSAYDYDDMGVERYQVAGLLQAGDENGPVSGEVGYGEEVPNATVQIRGQTSSRYAMKNYKIELKKNKGTWRGQRTINLNKHMADGLRFRNKLAYDLIKEIPQMLSLRTQFVHLYVKDSTSQGEQKFEDYGLYTQVEQLNKAGMKAHGLDSNGQLYKINFFEFYRYEDIIKKKEDPDYDIDKFENLLEIKGSDDHSKLIEMLGAVNDSSTPIEEILDKYFDTENITYWMAYMILTGNVDTQSRNVYIYSPQNSSKWYFIAWDNDAAFGNKAEEIKGRTEKGSWESGISNYWGNVLFQRCLKSDTFRDELDHTMADLKEFLSEERLEEMVKKYADFVKPYVYQMPDQLYAPLTPEQYDEVVEELPHEIEENYALYLESLEKPMPFFIGLPVIEGGRLKIGWDVSYDFDAEDIKYTVEVAKDYNFQKIIYSQKDIVLPGVELDVPDPGQYFVRIRSENSSGYVQDAFDYYVIDSGKLFGIKCFYVMDDSTVEEDIYEE